MKIGILGGGQLGRMMAMAGLPWGWEFRFLDPSSDPCAAQYGECIQGEYEDYQSLGNFLKGVDVVTYEFENVPVETARWLAERVPVYPNPNVLEIAQDRIIEKTYLASLGIPVTDFAAVQTREDLDQAVQKIGLPAVLKTTRFGYDGKGQMVLKTSQDVDAAWVKLGGRALILEKFVPFTREVSVIVARNIQGDILDYPLANNTHRDGILRQTQCPNHSLNHSIQTIARQYGQTLANALSYVGVLTIEFFVVGEDTLIANEIAPRVHNSGHWSIEGSETSQFANHLRAIAGMPLGVTQERGFSTMVNLIGKIPALVDLFAIPGANVHLYGKKERPGRKVGHITLQANSKEELSASLQRLMQVPGIEGE